MYIFVLAQEQIECTQPTDEYSPFHSFDTSYQRREINVESKIFKDSKTTFELYFYI